MRTGSAIVSVDRVGVKRGGRPAPAAPRGPSDLPSRQRLRPGCIGRM